ncbi:methylaspartate mutase subunit S [Desulforamulus hydrothermalis]|uniref:Glutamate mutase sigma subunit n=1 Tax=Desulforamulus hydrothermalis Lam5 = DSM 18033 TaxID=1121428 RepID=K8DYJ2_9FIRM|nr:methylaspartate mutase subunit S [Desulforamulus hydrothermalis]CCO07957.1 Methylaspartate mutase S chain [Desulforamulus hydrothermalis Lam5 = DSM 18033]SHG85391.1 glutamate mutase subunit S [Desulforamulus hydrothermalis Lam5 = DSM 18033]
MEAAKKQFTLVLGVIGADVHAVGNRILEYAFTEAGFKVVNIGVMASQEEFINAAVETNADAILVSSLYGHGEIDCRGLREKAIEAGIGNIKMYVGGNLVVGKQDWAEVEKKFLAMGFDRAYPPGTMPQQAIDDLLKDFGVAQQP